jgi:hypothetical protein
MFTPALAVLSIDPGYAKNITVYHVNEHKYGAIPVNMDTGDALGDMFFDMLEVIMYPVGCPNGTHTPSPSKFFNPCLNPEAGGEDLMVNKLTLEVDSRYSGYAACNVGLKNNSDPFGGYCKTDTYCCDCASGSGFHKKKAPCNATLGEENLYESFGKFLKAGCKPSIFQPHPSKIDCYRGNVFGKLNATNHGTWYSSLKQGYCGAADGAASSSSAVAAAASCTWRVVRVDKIVQRACHTRVFGSEVGKAAPDCFDGCGDQKTNTSSPCWVDCFYQAALGPDAGKPGDAGGGLPTEALVAAWQKPFLPEAEGGCPAQQAAAPWFEDEAALVEAR